VRRRRYLVRARPNSLGIEPAQLWQRRGPMTISTLGWGIVFGGIGGTLITVLIIRYFQDRIPGAGDGP
jgi:hypothetical protein